MRLTTLLAPLALLATSAAASETLLIALDAESTALNATLAPAFTAEGAAVATLEPPNRRALLDRLGAPDPRPLVVYLGGPARTVNGAEQVMVGADAVPLAVLIARLEAARRPRVVLLLDLCAEPGTPAGTTNLDAPPPAGFVLARARAAGAPCAAPRDAFAQRVRAALARRDPLPDQLVAITPTGAPRAISTLVDDAPLAGTARLTPTRLRELSDAAALGDPAAARHIAELAKAGEPEAQIAYGNLWYAGVGMTKDTRAAYGWYRRAAEAGHPRGQYLVGSMLENGDGVTADLEEAVRWYHLAATGGIGDASKALVRLGR